MRRILWILCVLGFLFFALRAVQRATTSPEDRMQRMITRMAEALDDGSPRRVVRDLGEDWHDPDTGIDRDMLRFALARFFAEQGRDSVSRELAYSAELPPAEFLVEYDSGLPDEGVVRGLARIHETRGITSSLAWEFRFEARCERREGRWWIVSTEIETLSGRRP